MADLIQWFGHRIKDAENGIGGFVNGAASTVNDAVNNVSRAVNQPQQRPQVRPPQVGVNAPRPTPTFRPPAPNVANRPQGFNPVAPLAGVGKNIGDFANGFGHTVGDVGNTVGHAVNDFVVKPVVDSANTVGNAYASGINYLGGELNGSHAAQQQQIMDATRQAAQNKIKAVTAPSQYVAAPSTVNQQQLLRQSQAQENIANTLKQQQAQQIADVRANNDPVKVGAASVSLLSTVAAPGMSKIAEPIAAFTRPALGNVGSRIVGNAISQAPVGAVLGASGQVQQTGSQTTLPELINAAGMGALGGAVLGGAAPEVANLAGKALKPAAVRAQNFGLKPPTKLTPEELAASTKVVQAQNNPVNPVSLTTQDTQLYRKAQSKLGQKPGTPDAHQAVVNALNAHRAFDVAVEQRRQATLGALENSSQFAQNRLIPGGTLGKIPSQDKQFIAEQSTPINTEAVQASEKAKAVNDAPTEAMAALKQEALKYKSAEEFVNSQSINHGTTAPIDKLSIEHANPFEPTLNRGIYTTADKSVAGTYATRNGIQGKVFSYKKPESGKVFDYHNDASLQKAGIKLPDVYKSKSAYNTYMNRVMDSKGINYADNLQAARENAVFDRLAIRALKNMGDANPARTWEEIKNTPVSQMASNLDDTATKVLDQINTDLHNQGFDFAKHIGGTRTGNKIHDVYIALHDNALQPQDTKQLTDLYNQAHTQPTPKVEAPTGAPIEKTPNVKTSVDFYDATKGETYGSIYAERGGKRVGKMDVSLLDNGDIVVNNVEVDPKYRRQGIATELYKEASKQSKSGYVNPTGQTELGSVTRKSLEGKGVIKSRPQPKYEQPKPFTQDEWASVNRMPDSPQKEQLVNKMNDYDSEALYWKGDKSLERPALGKIDQTKNQPGVHDSLADNLPNQTVRRQVDNVFSLTQQSPVSKDILPQSTDLYNQAHAEAGNAKTSTGFDPSKPVDANNRPTTVEDYVATGMDKRRATKLVETKANTKALNDQWAGRKYNEGMNVDLLFEEDNRLNKNLPGITRVKQVTGYKDVTAGRNGDQIYRRPTLVTEIVDDPNLVPNTPASSPEITQLQQRVDAAKADLNNPQVDSRFAHEQLAKAQRALDQAHAEATPTPKQEGKAMSVDGPTAAPSTPASKVPGQGSRSSAAEIPVPPRKQPQAGYTKSNGELAGKPIESKPVPNTRQVSQADRSYIDNTTGVTKKRGFVESVKNSDEVSTQTKRQVSGEYNVRSTEKMALEAHKYAQGNLKKVTNEVNESLAKKTGTISDQEIADAIAVAKRHDVLGNFDRSQQIYDQLAEHGTKGGQAIQAFSLLKNRTPEGVKFQMLRNLKKAGVTLTDSEQKEVGKLIDTVRKTKANTEARNRALFNTLDYVSKKIPTNNGDKIINFWRAGLLTAPKTTGGNILGNTSELAARELWTNPIAIATDKFFSMFTGKRTKTMSKGTLGGIKEGSQKGWDYMKTGYDPRNVGSKWDAPRRVNYKNKVIDNYVNGVYRWMGTQDQPFYYGAKAAAAYDLAKADGMNLKLKGQELADYVEKAIADENWKPQTFNTQKSAQDYARYAVYQNDTLLGNMAAGVKQAADRKGLRWATDFILPFTQVPSSIAMRIIDRTPIGTAREIVSQIRKGSFDQRAMAEAVGNGSFGIPVVAAGYALSQAGDITGDYPTDSKERKLWEEEGKQPYSVRIGDKWYSLNYIQPFGTILNIGHNIDEQRKAGKSEGEAWMTAVGSAGQSVTDQSFLKGLNGVLSALNDPDRSLGQFAKQTAGSTVPNFIRSFASATDDKQREIKDPMAAVQGSVPGLRQGLPEKQGMFGNTLERRDDAVNSYLNPLRPSKVKNEDNGLLNELRRLQGTDNGIVTTDFNKNSIKDVELSDEQVRDLNKQVNSAVQPEWDKAIKDPRYSSLSDEDKNSVLKRIKDNVADSVKSKFVEQNGLSTSAKYKASAKDPFSASNGVSISSKLSGDYKSTLEKYNSLSDDDRTKWFSTENNAEYQYNLAKYENDKANGTLTKAQELTGAKSLRKDKIGADYSKNVRDLYGVSKADLADYLATEEKGVDKKKIAQDLLAYDRALYDSGVSSSMKYKYGIAGSGKGGGKGKKGSGASLVNLTRYANGIRPPKTTGSKAPSLAIKQPQLKKVANKKFNVRTAKVSGTKKQARPKNSIA